MDWQLLFSMQQELDQRIKQEHHLESKDVVNDKILALLVEIGELANETRCFKFWSQKPPSDQAVILEEYVDGLHFIISIGLELGYSFHQIDEHPELENLNTTELFLQVYEKAVSLKSHQGRNSYQSLFSTFLALGNKLGFEEELIQRAYISKNEVNHKRQDEGY
ncbi:dUTP diphosphatase [Salinibacillus xinjiangensis]|uniref:dUTPase n=1 Tax=Salinibacillus xinjiangensis TaxID=1229268 RepID=A0A6G1X9F6_9BACI|nr:dUTP diphosphatase [Salinibacillus xinjiangensis]MRG87651.1 dUTPase [Salinibacillus xinjiangensis]